MAYNGFIKALIYKTPVHEDFDGDPEAYAAPFSVADLRPRGGVMHETSLKNATNEKDPNPVFHAPPTPNTYHWTGVRSRAPTPWDVAGDVPGHHNPGPGGGPEPGTLIDFRDFLRSSDGTFPIFRPGTDFYAAQTAMNGPDGQAVNALTVPYAVLSTSLRPNGRVSLGDVGLAIRVATGKASHFLFADAGAAVYWGSRVLASLSCESSGRAGQRMIGDGWTFCPRRTASLGRCLMPTRCSRKATTCRPSLRARRTSSLKRFLASRASLAVTHADLAFVKPAKERPVAKITFFPRNHTHPKPQDVCGLVRFWAATGRKCFT